MLVLVSIKFSAPAVIVNCRLTRGCLCLVPKQTADVVPITFIELLKFKWFVNFYVSSIAFKSPSSIFFPNKITDLTSHKERISTAAFFLNKGANVM